MYIHDFTILVPNHEKQSNLKFYKFLYTIATCSRHTHMACFQLKQGRSKNKNTTLPYFKGSFNYTNIPAVVNGLLCNIFAP